MQSVGDGFRYLQRLGFGVLLVVAVLRFRQGLEGHVEGGLDDAGDAAVGVAQVDSQRDAVGLAYGFAFDVPQVRRRR